jgi:uncharacterized membrane protein
MMGAMGGPGHSHAAGDIELRLHGRMRLVLRVVTVAIALGTVAGMVALWPSGDRSSFDFVGFVNEFHDADTVAVLPLECPGGDPETGLIRSNGRTIECATYQFQLLSGPDRGEIISIDAYDIAAGYGFAVSDKVVLAYDPDAFDERFAYSIADRQRKPVLFWLAVLFAASVVMLGRLRGFAALGGLVATLVLLMVFTLPAIIEGSDALLVAVVSASAISFVAIYLAHGVSQLTTVALLGTIGSLAVTTVLAVAFIDLAALTGFAAEEAGFLALGNADFDLRGLILAGVIIGALGAIDDMTVTQASAVAEIRLANAKMGITDLYRAGTRIGRDHVASTVNTLVLAYVGASLPLLILFSVTDQPLGTVANSELVATEIVRTLVGSIGLVAAVPLTTWLAAVVVSQARPQSTAPDAVAATATQVEPAPHDHPPVLEHEHLAPEPGEPGGGEDGDGARER